MINGDSSRRGVRVYSGINSRGRKRWKASSLTRSYTARMLRQYVLAKRASHYMSIVRRDCVCVLRADRPAEKAENNCEYTLMSYRPTLMIYVDPVQTPCTHKFRNLLSSIRALVPNCCISLFSFSANQSTTCSVFFFLCVSLYRKQATNKFLNDTKFKLHTYLHKVPCYTNCVNLWSRELYVDQLSSLDIETGEF